MIKLFYFNLFLILTISQNDRLTSYHLDEGIKKVKVPFNQTMVIDKLPNLGATLQTLLTFHGKQFYDHPCMPINSGITFKNQQEFPLTEQYSNQQFEDNFINGTFTLQWPQLIAMAHINSGVLVLSNIGKFTLVLIKDNSIRIIQQIFFSRLYSPIILKGKIILIFYAEQEIIYMLGTNFAVYFKVSPSRTNLIETHFSMAFICNLPFTSELHNYAISGKYIFLARGPNGLSIYQISKAGNTILLKTYQGNFVDIKVISKNNTKIIYALDSEEGLITYIMNENLQFFKQDLIIQVQKAILFDIYRNSLVILRKEKENYYYADDYHLLNSTWILLNTWAFDSQIFKVLLTREFAIFLGLNGHYAIQHSIFKDFYNLQGTSQTGYMSSQISIHGLIELDFFQKDLKFEEFAQQESKILFGITRHKLIFAEWKEQPLTIECYSDNEEHIIASPLYLDFNYNTTQCSSKIDKDDDLSMCIQEKKYKIYFVKSFLTMKHKIALFFIIFFLLTFFITIIVLMIIRYDQFQKERVAAKKTICELAFNENSKLVIDLDEKINSGKLAQSINYLNLMPSFLRTPISEKIKQ